MVFCISADRERTNVLMQASRMGFPDLVKAILDKMRSIEGSEEKFKVIPDST